MDSRKRLYAILVLAVMCCSVSGQKADSLPAVKMTYSTDYLKGKAFERESLLSRSIAPALMFTAGSLYHDYIIGDKIQHAGTIQNNWGASDVSDVIQYLPAGLMLATCITLKFTNYNDDWHDVGRLLFAGAVGAVAEAAITNGLKYSVKRLRPDRSEYNSFPSGHTATTFFAATLLHKEYGQTMSPWFSVAGYGIAAATGMARVAATRHWISDVMAGAGIGIFSGEFAYWLNDAIFGKKGMASGPVTWQENDDWSFGMYTFYNFNKIAGNCNSVPESLRPAYTIGIEAERRLCDMLGLSLTGDISQVRWDGDDRITLPDMAAIPLMNSFHIGLVGHFPIYKNLDSFAGVYAGLAVGDDYEFIDERGDALSASFPTSFDARARAGLSIRTSHCSVVHLYGGVEEYGGYGLMLSAGTSLNLTF